MEKLRVNSPRNFGFPFTSTFQTPDGEISISTFGQDKVLAVLLNKHNCTILKLQIKKWTKEHVGKDMENKIWTAKFQV